MKKNKQELGERYTNEGSDAFTDKFQEGSLATQDVTKGFFDLADEFDIITGKKVKK